ncbi:MAG: DUF6807 family protein [Saprospiraceae bacterium]
MKKPTIITNLSFALLFCFGVNSFGQGFSTQKNAEGLEVKEGSQKVLFYQQKPKSLDGKYERAHYIHPLYGLNGEVLSEDFPEDHYHHRGVFWAWHQIVLNGTKVADAWEFDNIFWAVKKVKTKNTAQGLQLSTRTFWQSVLAGQGPKWQSLFKEETVITIHPTEKDYRVIDFQIKMIPLKVGLALGGSEDSKGYGGFSPRIKLPEDIQFMSPKGEVKAQTNGLEAGPWMDVLGTFDGVHPGGVAILTHPLYPSGEQLWILRDKRSMQNAAYPGNQPIDLTKGKPLELRYRLVIHQQGMEADFIEKLHQDFIK